MLNIHSNLLSKQNIFSYLYINRKHIRFVLSVMIHKLYNVDFTIIHKDYNTICGTTSAKTSICKQEALLKHLIKVLYITVAIMIL